VQTSSKKSGVPLDIRLTAVPELFGLQLLVLVCGETAVWFLVPKLSLSYLLPLALLVLVAAVHGIRKHALLKAADSVRRITWTPEEGWKLYTRAGQVVSVSLSPDSRVFRWAIILCFTANRTWHGRHGGYTAVLLRNAVDSVSMRQLRVFLNSNDLSTVKDRKVSPF